MSRNLQVNYAISFLFHLDLILNTCKIFIRCDSFEILNFTINKALSVTAAPSSLILVINDPERLVQSGPLSVIVTVFIPHMLLMSCQWLRIYLTSVTGVFFIYNCYNLLSVTNDVC